MKQEHWIGYFLDEEKEIIVKAINK